MEAGGSPPANTCLLGSLGNQNRPSTQSKCPRMLPLTRPWARSPWAKHVPISGRWSEATCRHFTHLRSGVYCLFYQYPICAALLGSCDFGVGWLCIVKPFRTIQISVGGSGADLSLLSLTCQVPSQVLQAVPGRLIRNPVLLHNRFFRSQRIDKALGHK